MKNKSPSTGKWTPMNLHYSKKETYTEKQPVFMQEKGLNLQKAYWKIIIANT